MHVNYDGHSLIILILRWADIFSLFSNRRNSLGLLEFI